MSATVNPLAPHHLPGFLPGADGSDPLFTGVLIFLIVSLMAVGNLYFKLHAVPERMAHKQNNIQLQLITVLALLALFTHNNIFWVAAMLLAVVRPPDFSTPINSIAKSLEQLAGRAEKEPPSESPASDSEDSAKKESPPVSAAPDSEDSAKKES